MENNSLIMPKSGTSPFDSIRRFDENQQEYWSARELMRMLGYQKWESFGAKDQKTANTSKTGNQKISTVCRAIISCNTSGSVVDDNFTHFLSSGTGFSAIPEDWKLSRFACYLVAMCGDVTKVEIASAQSYFATQTRKAEVVIPAQIDRIRELELEIELRKVDTQKSLAEQSLLNTRHLIVATCPEPIQQKIFGYAEITKVEYRDRIVKDSVVINDGSTLNKTEICKRYSILTKNGSPDYKRLNIILDKLNLPNSAWEETDVVKTNRELKRDYLEVLDRALYTADERQLWLGENNSID